MSEEGKFWFSIIASIIVLIISITVIISVYDLARNEKIKRMVSEGAHPIVARCALYDSFSYTGSALICMEALKK